MLRTTSIAVLPFKNFSNDTANEYFCDGMTEEIINALARIDQLKVISRTSSFYYKERNVPISEIGNALKVTILLEGSVRVAGNMLRVSAHLIDIDEDENFWSAMWERSMDNLFEVQDEISLLISDKLREHVGHFEIADQLVKPPTQNLGAYQHYLKGRYLFNHWNPVDTNSAIIEFERAIDQDSHLIEGYLGLADAYSFLAVAGFAPREEAWAKANQAVEKARKIDPENAGLNYLLANQAFFTEANFALAFDYLLKSLASIPTYADSRRFLSFFYTLRGDFDQAKEHLFYVKSIDPLNPETLFFEANLYYRLGEYERAIPILEGLLAENDKNLPARLISIQIHIKKGNALLAKEKLEEVPPALFTPDERLGLLCLIDLAEGNATSIRLQELVKASQHRHAHHAHSYLFMAYAFLKKFDKAYEILQLLFEEQSSLLMLGFSDPLAENIKESDLYLAYHQRIYPKPTQKAPLKNPKQREQNETKVADQLAILHEFVEEELPYLNPQLSLRLLAEQTQIHPNQLSWLINEQIGKNFNEFINGLRIAHFKKLVVDPSNSHISIVGLAFESGFNSKTVFNTAFKKEVGMTPKQFQKSHS